MSAIVQHPTRGMNLPILVQYVIGPVIGKGMHTNWLHGRVVRVSSKETDNREISYRERGFGWLVWLVNASVCRVSSLSEETANRENSKSAWLWLVGWYLSREYK